MKMYGIKRILVCTRFCDLIWKFLTLFISSVIYFSFKHLNFYVTNKREKYNINWEMLDKLFLNGNWPFSYISIFIYTIFYENMISCLFHTFIIKLWWEITYLTFLVLRWLLKINSTSKVYWENTIFSC